MANAGEKLEQHQLYCIYMHRRPEGAEYISFDEWLRLQPSAIERRKFKRRHDDN